MRAHGGSEFSAVGPERSRARFWRACGMSARERRKHNSRIIPNCARFRCQIPSLPHCRGVLEEATQGHEELNSPAKTGRLYQARSANLRERLDVTVSRDIIVGAPNFIVTPKFRRTQESPSPARRGGLSDFKVNASCSIRKHSRWPP
jgi:hypothetical protein